jgi:MFS family permease
MDFENRSQSTTGNADENAGPDSGIAQAAGEQLGKPTWLRSGVSSALRSLGHRNYQLFFFGQLISLVGTWIQMIAQFWLVYRLTDSASLLGLVGFSSQIPVLLLATVGGAVADRINRHRILIGTQSASMLLAFILATLTLTSQVTVWHVFVLSALLGAVNAFDIPARQAFVVELVGRDDLTNAIALNSSMFNGARIIGPAVAGILVAGIGEGWCFFLNGVSFLAVIAGLLMMTDVQHRRRLQPGSPLAEIVEGFRFVGHNRPIRALLLLLGLVSLVGMPYTVLMPIFADRILHGGPSGLGLLMGASGVGALIGALRLAARRGTRGLGRKVALSATGFGIFLVLFALSKSFWLSAVLLVPLGYFMISEMASSNTLIQSMVPDRLRGRVMAVYSMMFIGMGPFGALWAGATADQVGAPLTVAVGGTVCILGAALFGRRLPDLRKQMHEMIVAVQTTSGDPPDQVTDKSPKAMTKGE